MHRGGRSEGPSWRGGRGRGRGRGWDGWQPKYGYHSRGGPPPGLRGKEIGLWHARRQIKRNAEDEKKKCPMITFNGNRELSMSLKWLAQKFPQNGDPGDNDFDAGPTNSDTVIWRRQKSSPLNQAMASNPADSTCDFDERDEVDSEQDEFMSPETSFESTETSYESTEEYPVDQNGISQLQDAEPEEAVEQMENQIEFSEFGFGGRLDQSLFPSNSLPKDARKDEKLRQMLEIQQQSAEAKKFLGFRMGLPAYQRQGEFVKLAKEKRVVVVSGVTGCGKSTQLPQALLDEMIKTCEGSKTRIICTQPRRISAISLAERVAEERGETLKTTDENSRSIGYQIRLEYRRPRECGSLLYCTTGIVLRWLTVDPLLTGISHLFLDEIHERDLQSDLLLILVRDLLKHRSDLRLILMSATLEAETFLNYFSVYDPALFKIEGRSFPVQSYFLEDVYERIRYRPTDNHDRRFDNLPTWKRKMQDRLLVDAKKKRQLQIRALRDKKYSETTNNALEDWRDDEEKIDAVLICELTRHICDTSEPGAAILIFVAGSQDIQDVIGQFKKDRYFSPSRFVLLPLHSMIPTSDQHKVFKRPPQGCRKIVISTNIAETSVTIDDVVYVIDSGKIKRQNFDKELNCLTLKPEWVSKANAIQRQGRAGRCQPGICFHLFPSWKFNELDDRTEPEICRTRLTSLCLDIKALTKSASWETQDDKSVVKFLQKAVDPPEEESIKLALDDLYAMGALTSEEEVTPLGWHLLRFPVDPHCAKMIVFSAIYSCVDPVLTIAACLDHKVPFYQPIGMEARVDECKKMLQWPGVKSDHLMWVTAFNEWFRSNSPFEANRFVYDNFLSVPTLKFIDKMKKQFAGELFAAGFTASADPLDPASNENSTSEKVIQAVLAAGLYPKVAFVARQVDQRKAAMSRGGPPLLRIKNRQKVKIHPSSVNYGVPNFETQYLIYHTSVKSTAHFLRECSMVSPLALCLAGGHLHRYSDDTIVLDEWIRFFVDDEGYAILNEMRRFMRVLLKERLDTHGSENDEETKETRGKLMQLVCNALNHERLMFRNF